MTLLILGLAIFFGIHSLSIFREKREILINKIGALPYKGLFSVVSILGFVLLVIGKGRAEFIHIWQPPVILAMVTKLLMLFAWILMVAAYIPSNAKRIIRHPMLLSVKLWALAHLLINGDLASIILFGSFLAYGVIAMISANKRSEWLKPDPKPFYMNIVVIVVALAVYVGVAMHHAQLFGVAVI